MTADRIQFLIGGVQKAGTSALAAYLSTHPQLSLPTAKEAHVFDAPEFNDGWTSSDIDARYGPLYPHGKPDAMRGDATPIYILHERFVERIARYNPDMRWIVLLRHPVERAVSHYHMEKARGSESWPLLPALLFERWRLRGHTANFGDGSPLRHHSYRMRGDYTRQLDALFARFPRNQVLVLRSEELELTPVTCLSRVCAFLQVGELAPGAAYPKVFEGRYKKPSPNSVTWRLTRWLMRREIRSMHLRHGIVFD